VPIGPYPDFNACVAANQDKRSPEGFCADLERNLSMTLAAPETKTVEGVEIFASGSWTDSQGEEREWTEQDLDKLLKNFRIDSEDHPIPVKVGHTDDTFNARVADELGIPPTLLVGDEGQGAPRLGRILELRKDGDRILADFTDVPEPITNMIEAGMFNAVSVEIDMPDDDDPHLSGVAILGAELPAISSLAALDTANIFTSNKATQKWVTLQFPSRGLKWKENRGTQDGEPIQVDPEELAAEFAEISVKMEEIIRGKKGSRIIRAFWAEMKRKMSDLTGKRFSDNSIITQYFIDGKVSLGNWEAIVEQQKKDCNLKLPIELVAAICPDCAGEMGRKGMTAMKIQNFELPDQLKTSLMAMIGEPDSNWFARCMDFDLGVKTGEKLGFCAWLMKEYTGEWPSLEGGKISNAGQGGPGTESVEQPGENNIEKMEENNMGESDFILSPEDMARLPELYAALGLDETATLDDVLAAIEAMRAGAGAEGDGGALPADMVPLSEEDKAKEARIAALEQELVGLKGFNKNLLHDRMVMTYTKQAEEWNIPGKPEELAEELTNIHETAGKEVAEKVVDSYKKSHKVIVDAGIFTSIGSAKHSDADNEPDEFEQEVDAYAEANSVDFNKALGIVAKVHGNSAKFQAYKNRVLEHMGGA